MRYKKSEGQASSYEKGWLNGAVCSRLAASDIMGDSPVVGDLHEVIRVSSLSKIIGRLISW